MWDKTDATQEEENEEYEKIFGEKLQSWEPPEISKSYVWFDFEFKLVKGIFELCKFKKGSGDELESLIFKYESFLFKITLRTPGGDLCILIQDLSILSSSSEEERTFCQKLQPNLFPLLLLQLSLKPESENVAASVEFQSQPFEIYFDSQALSLFLSFFIVPTSNEAAKTAAWDTLQEFQDSTQETLSDLLYGESKYLLKIHACGPKIMMPSPTGQGKFIVNLGEADISNEPNESDSLYENFYLQITNINFLYSPDPQRIISVVRPFEINTSLSLLKSRYKKRKWENNDRQFMETADLVMSGSIPRNLVILSPSIYNQILRIGEVFVLDDEI